MFPKQTEQGSPHTFFLSLLNYSSFLLQLVRWRFRAWRGALPVILYAFGGMSRICTAQGNDWPGFLSDNHFVMFLAASPGLTGGLAAPLVAAGAAAVIGSAGAAALGSTAGIAVMASLFGAAGAGLTGKRVTTHFSATKGQDQCVNTGLMT